MNKLFLSSGESFTGVSFGADTEMLGEVVFTTGMTGYLETLTDPSYYGQIVCFTFPLIGNHGVFEKDSSRHPGLIDKTFESEKIWVKGVILTEWSAEYSHHQGFLNFSNWLKEHNIPGLAGVDTRALTQVLREKGCIMGSLSEKALPDYTDPLAGRYVPAVSPETIEVLTPENDRGKTIAFIDCGAKNGIFRNFLDRGVKVIRLPFDANPYQLQAAGKIPEFDGVFFSNGPGDPDTLHETIASMKDCLAQDKPIFGICLGNQILALGAGAKTKKMRYGHRGVNQPCKDLSTGHCIVTSQNHGFVVDEDSLPAELKPLFTNLNDNSNEGLYHESKPFFSVQFHPEASAGPEDAEYLFDRFIDSL